eukprot:3921372-Prymnesium_polylepis.1
MHHRTGCPGACPRPNPQPHGRSNSAAREGLCVHHRTGQISSPRKRAGHMAWGARPIFKDQPTGMEAAARRPRSGERTSEAQVRRR